jgi:hypothetical protein
MYHFFDSELICLGYVHTNTHAPYSHTNYLHKIHTLLAILSYVAFIDISIESFTSSMNGPEMTFERKFLKIHFG